jgi:hypothetical protein
MMGQCSSGIEIEKYRVIFPFEHLTTLIRWFFSKTRREYDITPLLHMVIRTISLYLIPGGSVNLTKNL